MIGRREFIGSAAAFAGLPALAKYVPYPALDVRRLTIRAGATSSFKLLQVSDVHLAFCDARDNAEKLALYARRAQGKANARHYLDEAVALARREHAQLVSTGDMWDFLSVANVETAGRIFAADNWFACTGNHEYTEDLDGEKENEAWKLRSIDRVREAYPNDPFFASRVVNGVNLIALDDVYYQVSDKVAAAFEQEAKRGLPMVILVHVPFFTPKLVEHSLEASAKSRMGKCGWVTGAPKEIVRTYGNEGRINAQMPDATTQKFCARLQSEPLVKAILAGHVHWPWTEQFSSTAVQYVCGATFNGAVQLINVE